MKFISVKTILSGKSTIVHFPLEAVAFIANGSMPKSFDVYIKNTHLTQGMSNPFKDVHLEKADFPFVPN